jgi:hypothetical protein
VGEDRLIARIERAVGVPGLVERLAELPGSDLQSLLLALHRRRAASVSPPDVLRAYETSRFVQPSPLDPAELLELSRLAFSVLPSTYELVELSPVSPFGASATLGAISQDWVLSAGRNTEVVSDPTIALALECAVRRRARGFSPSRVDLAAAHRAVRGQPFSPPDRQHFGLIALCSAGRGGGGHDFDAQTLVDHIGVYLRLIERVGSGAAVTLTPLEGGLSAERLEGRVVATLTSRFPAAHFAFDHDRQGGAPGYYVRTCFTIWLEAETGRQDVADGGFTDWAERLLSDRKERLLTSGLGAERLTRR